MIELRGCRLAKARRYSSADNVLDKLGPINTFSTMLKSLKDGVMPERDYMISHPVRVGILDSGVYANSAIFPNLTGASFIEDLSTDDSHWHTVTNPHGTIMASLIRKISPNCHLFAARTHFGSDMHGGDVGAIVQVRSGPVPSNALIFAHTSIVYRRWTGSSDIKWT